MTKPLSPEEKEQRRTARLLRGRPKRQRRGGWWDKCATKDCGQCIGCSRRAGWAAGKYQRTSSRGRPDKWLEEHDARLRELARTMERRAIAEVLTRADPYLTLTETARALGIGLPSLSYWREVGLVEPRRVVGRGKGVRLVVRARDLPEIRERIRRRYEANRRRLCREPELLAA